MAMQGTLDGECRLNLLAHIYPESHLQGLE